MVDKVDLIASASVRQSVPDGANTYNLWPYYVRDLATEDDFFLRTSSPPVKLALSIGV